MANQIPEEALAAIEDAVRRNPNGVVSAPEILRALTTPVPPRTLQYRLKHLVTREVYGRLVVCRPLADIDDDPPVRELHPVRIAGLADFAARTRE
ncbi:hypothetical protein [Roseiarcus fermentans]|uniref:hypothetical protein n=1 Tax=Roseiarcus fermentans TaxID=1473586 RepID=UPI0011BE9588|nr:hypothetical protein [Roseiarcus fermentans]